jgi:hypothetical protein
VSKTRLDNVAVGEGWIRAANDDRIEFFCAEAITSITVKTSMMGPECSVRVHGPNISLLADDCAEAEALALQLIKLVSKPKSKWRFGYAPNIYEAFRSSDGSARIVDRKSWAALDGPGGIIRWELLICELSHHHGDRAIVAAYDMRDQIVVERHCYMGGSRDMERNVREAVAFIRQSLPEFPDVPAKETT